MKKPKDLKPKTKFIAAGFFCGLLNGFFGSGGGLVAVPALKAAGLTAKESHATSVALIFFLSLISAAGYMVGGAADFGLILPMLPAGAAGAFFGALWLKNIDPNTLRRIFAALMIFSGGRLLLR